MNAAWQRLTLIQFSPPQWTRSSVVWRLKGLLKSWRQSSQLITWGNEIAVALLGLVFMLAPFVPNGLTGLLIVACAAFWVLLTLSDDILNPYQISPVHLILGLYWIVAIAATALSPVKVAAATGLAKLTLYMCVFVLGERVLRSQRWRSILISIYLHTALIVSVEGWRQQFFGAAALATWNDPTATYGDAIRVYSFLGNPNLLAAYILPTIPLSLCALFAWKRWGPKLLAAVMLVVNGACMYWTGSRGAWIGLVVALLVSAALLLYWLLPRLPKFWRLWAFPIVFGTLAGIAILGFLTVEPLRERVLSIFADREDSSNNYRINVWASVRQMIRAYPILGIGPGNTAFNKIYPLYQLPNYSALSAYSIYLELLVEVGVVGFTCFLWFLLVLFNRAFVALQQLRTRQSQEVLWLIAGVATLTGMLAHGAVDTVWYRPEIATLWWFMVALVTSYATKPAPEPLRS
ncbi:MAG: IctB family putative bicarbonate transporter [Thermosynechococcaceae cyanobacterium]